MPSDRCVPTIPARLVDHPDFPLFYDTPVETTIIRTDLKLWELDSSGLVLANWCWPPRDDRDIYDRIVEAQKTDQPHAIEIVDRIPINSPLHLISRINAHTRRIYV